MTKAIDLHFELDHPPEKVWRALNEPALRERWLPGHDMAVSEPVALTPGETVSYRMRDAQPPFSESIVTFRIASNSSGGTLLHIVQTFAGTTLDDIRQSAANGNTMIMLAA